MPDDKTIQIKCSEEFKLSVDQFAQRDKRSASNYGYIALQEKMKRDEPCWTCKSFIDKTCRDSKGSMDCKYNNYRNFKEIF